MSQRRLIVATLTPFDRSGGVDLGAARAHAAWLVERGVHGLAPTGTTGEFLFLSLAEKEALYAAVARAAGGALVMPCVWHGAPGGTVRLARAAVDSGAGAVFLPPPLYQPVAEDDVMAWYEQVRRAVDVPVLAYHHPRTHNPLSPALFDRLVRQLGIAGIKDSSGERGRVAELAALHPGTVWCGGDPLLGSDDIGPVAGHISRYANLRPDLALRLACHGAEPRGLATVISELGAIDRAGGIPAMKLMLGLGCRAPVTAVDGGAIADLPRPDYAPAGPDLPFARP